VEPATLQRYMNALGIRRRRSSGPASARRCALDIVGRTDSAFAMPYENGRPIFICRNSRLSLTQLWDRLKRYR
jgi:hypothetical protein